MYPLFIIMYPLFIVVYPLFIIMYPLFIMYPFLQVYAVVDEMFLAGEIRETSQTKVLHQLQYLNQLD